MSGHTPGPWTLDDVEPEIEAMGLAESDMVARSISGVDGRNIGTVLACDAKLIAAAPSLADALEAMLAAYDYTDSDAQAVVVDAANEALRAAGRLP